MNNVEIVTMDVVNQLRELIETDNYLFHITSEESLKRMIDEKMILPLTMDGTRQSVLRRLGKVEKGTSSFTENPIQIYEQDYVGCFDGKDVVMVFDRDALKKEGIPPAIYNI